MVLVIRLNLGEALEKSLVPIEAGEIPDVSALGGLERDDLAVLALARVVVGLHAGVVDLVKVESVHGTDHLPAYIHDLLVPHRERERRKKRNGTDKVLKLRKRLRHQLFSEWDRDLVVIEYEQIIKFVKLYLFIDNLHAQYQE